MDNYYVLLCFQLFYRMKLVNYLNDYDAVLHHMKNLFRNADPYS